jgi:2-C-methyl-D-erythritol 4-phosphate cytidylyltransferase
VVTAVIAAAGSGERLGAGGPKAFLPLAGRPMVEWSIDAFRAAAPMGSIVVACPVGYLGLQGPDLTAVEEAPTQDGSAGEGPTKPMSGDDLIMVEGGPTRTESVANALQAVETELVAIHDAARPLVSAALIEAVVETLLADPAADAAIAATPVTDTIKRSRPVEDAPEGVPNRVLTPRPHPGVVEASIDVSGVPIEASETVDRAQLWAAQTPQVFRTHALRRALDADPGQVAAATDEAMLVEAVGGRVLIHPASPQNLKVTTPLDMRVAELLLAERDPAA